MQRSRRALLLRRAALEKTIIHKKSQFCKVSASLFIVLWVFIFLLNSLISKGNDYRDGQETILGDFNPHEAPSSMDEVIDFQLSPQSSDTSSFNSQQQISISKGNSPESDKDGLVNEGSKLDASTIQKDQIAEFVSDSSINLEKESLPKSDRLSHITPLGLDEFRNKAIISKEKAISRQTGTVIHRVEPSGKEYNYASSSKGAKVLDYNKEAKGASNILDKDKDKYLRNPCSADDKYVVIELSEETLVDTIEIANFEHYSSNLKDFEILSSLVYPTDNWVKLGNFTAANVKHAQLFHLPEPKWARYLKINLLSHYGSEFFCTLSVVEVYGVDAVERMLEDLISDEKNRLEHEEKITEQVPLKDHNGGEDTLVKIADFHDQSSHESSKPKPESSKGASPGPVVEAKPSQLGRMPGDTVLKVLMQKVQTLDLNFSVLERYLEELNSRYGHIFKDFDDDMSNKDLLLEKIRLEIKNLQNSKDAFASDIGELLIWRTMVSSQLDQLVRDNAVFRSDIKAVQEHQNNMENKGLAVIFVSFIFGCLATSKLLLNVLLSICTVNKSESLCRTSSGWLVLLLSSSIVMVIMIL
ncbi:hypothetical protein Cni_G12336 [Canna indica]|uniref:SUN domain-containing protein n=1 Tax=Canna indica TaxID=4628 RepID=A0AAQ3QBP4_9LILI|nr:hypothetical protein Cni_G12336 [Canna indica]